MTESGRRICAIVNPYSSNGRTRREWPAIAKKLGEAFGPIEHFETAGPMDACRLTSAALDKGADLIIAVGGDGTINEVVNGFFGGDRTAGPEGGDVDAVLGIVSMGTGGDFRRTFGMPADWPGQIDHMKAAGVRRIDVGKATFTDTAGHEAVRYFDNIASFGLSGAVALDVNRPSLVKHLGGKVAFQWAMVKALFTHRNKPVRLTIDGDVERVFNVHTVAVSNGQYFGGGMHIAPDARPDDGQFHVIVMADLGMIETIRNTPSIYRGDHLKHPKLTMFTGKKIDARPVNETDVVLLDVDGEMPGRLPATFEIIPGALRFRG